MDRAISVKCFVPWCTNTTTTKRHKVFVKVPTSLQQKWCRKVGLEHKASSHLYCCEDHLNLQEDLQNYYEWKLMRRTPRLKPTAKLTILFPNNENVAVPSTKRYEDCIPSTSKIENTAPVLRELLLQNVAKSKSQQTCTITKPIKGCESSELLTKTTALHYSSEPSKASASTHPFKVDVATQCDIKKADKSTNTKHNVKSKQIEITSLESEESVLESENPSLYGGTTTTTSTETYCKTENEYLFRKITVDMIMNNPKLYIGLPKQYLWLIKHIASQNRSVKELDLFLCLLKLKQNDTVTRICNQFQISKVTFTKIFSNGIAVLANFFQNLVFCPTPLEIKKTLPLVFKIRYSNVQMILDAFEIQIEKPRRPMQQAQTWSQYKSCNTVKYLVGCTPNGFVSFISKGYGGRISDKALVEKSDLLDTLPCNSVIMADRGFKEIESLLISKNIKLLRPPSVYSNIKPTKEEVLLSKVIASLRIHIERVIRRLREFRFLKPHSVVHHKHVGYLDHMVLIACGLINLQSEIIKSI